ncbi:hypothetical protein BDQ17DRAFT_1432965 [Cyathus striatus]|nr:hypothetical protein BDQ17DRAFT_1432965 [Cyathus striatus]
MSGYPQAFSDILPPYSMDVNINPFRTMGDFIAPLSQSISPLQTVQDMEMYPPDAYHTPADLYASTSLKRGKYSVLQISRTHQVSFSTSLPIPAYYTSRTGPGYIYTRNTR